MPRGQQDFGMYSPQTIIAGLADMGELAARLGSIVTYDRRGYVADFDDFEDTVLHWTPTGAGSAVFGEVPKVGSQSCLITTPAAANAGERIERRIQLIGAERLGIEISFRDLDDNARLEFEAYNTDVDGDYHLARLRLRHNATTTLEIYTPDGYIPIASTAALQSIVYYTTKLVFDVSTGYYTRVLFAGVEYDISAYELRQGAGGFPASIRTTIYCVTEEAVAHDVDMDCYILTMNEP